MNTKQIRQTILDLAIRGELVPQDPTDEPASVLLERIRAEKEQLIKDKKLKRDKKDNKLIDEIPFELPEGWEWCRLGEIGNNIQYGLSNPSSTFGKYKILRITDIQNNSVSWDTVPFVDIKEEEVNSFLLKKRDILFARTGATVGKSYLVSDLPYSTVFASYLIRISVFEVISIQYIKYFFESDIYWEQITDKSVGIGQPNVNGTSLKTLLIPLPPLAEQHRIAQKVEQLLTIVDTIEQLQEELKSDVKQAKNQVLSDAIAGKLTHQDPNDEPAEELLKRIGKTTTTATDTPYEKLPEGWAWCRLGEVANISMGQSPKGETVMRNSNGIEFHQGKIYFTDKYIDKSPFFTSEPTKITSNSVLLCVRAPVGEVNLVNREVCIGRGLCAIEPLGNISIDFCFFWLILLKDYFNENSTGSTFSSISGEIIRNAFIPLPPLAEQHRIVQQIETFFASFDQIEKELV